MVAHWWISFIFVVFLRDVNAKVYIMDPQVLQSMLPPLNASEELNSDPNESSEENSGTFNVEADSSDDYARIHDYDDSNDDENDKPILRGRMIGQFNKKEHVSHSLKVKSEKVEAQHQARLAELMEYLQTHMMSTVYFHNEMKRILRQRKVKDGLRKMVTVLEHEPAIKGKVVECYRKYKAQLSKTKDLWKHPTNDLVINYGYDY